jgi:cytosine/adenosine deaminase-related metal-dependent hydrolase
MALMSVKRFLTQLEEEAAYRKVVSMLLDGVATNAVNLDPETHSPELLQRIGELRQEIGLGNHRRIACSWTPGRLCRQSGTTRERPTASCIRRPKRCRT